MADDKIINFDKLQEKWDEQEVDKFESFLNSKMEAVFSGQISMSEFSKSMKEYQDKNNISNEKLIDLQKKLLNKMGVDLDINNIDKEISKLEESIKKEGKGDVNIRRMAFFDYYSDQIENKEIPKMELKNSKNDMMLLFIGNKIIIITENKVDFSDDEFNQIVAGYKSTVEGSLKIITCEATKVYEYH